MLRLPRWFSPRRPDRPKPARGVVFTDETRGSTFLADALRDCAPSLAAPLPEDPARFRAEMPEGLARFELARRLDPGGRDIAASLARWSRAHLALRGEDGAAPLVTSLQRTDGQAAALRLVAAPTARCPAGLRLPWQGISLRGAEAVARVEALHAEHQLDDGARDGLVGLLGREAPPPLAGERFAVLGAAAELAPTELLLEAGADVLWIDRASPEPWLAEQLADRPYAGRLFSPAAPTCLLEQPEAVLAAVSAFCHGRADGLEGHRRVHLGAFAYAPGAGRELRLAGSMEAIAHVLGPERLASFSTYVSPTTPSAVSPRDRRESERRAGALPAWQKALRRIGALGAAPWVADGPLAIATAAVPMQGPSYQAAQYLTKMMACEALAASGAVRVSANVAGITATRSLEHPLFQIAFAGARHFGVQVFEPASSRALSGLLMLSDLFGPPSTGPRSVHGGVASLPFRLDETIRAGALVGLATRPSLLGGFVTGRGR
jgi:hypothetical protein